MNPILYFPLITSFIAMICVIIIIIFIKQAKADDPRMQEVAGFIRQGANAFLYRQYLTELVVVIIIAAIIYFILGIITSLTFIFGVTLSLLGGYMGLQVAVRANLLTAGDAIEHPDKALHTAFNGGSVMGLSVVGLSLLGVTLLFIITTAIYPLSEAIQYLVGFGMGASLAALFTQVGGGIFTKGADVAADLVGKIEEDIPEDDPRNPAVIADLVGDNVGDCAGRGSDLFESLSDDMISAMLLGIAFIPIFGIFGVIFPLIAASIGVFASIIGILAVRRIRNLKPIHLFVAGLTVTGVVAGIGLYPLVMIFLGDIRLYFAGLVGLISSLLIGLISVYYTSEEFRPVKRLAIGASRGPSLNIIEGLSIGFEAPVLPIILIGISIMIAYIISGFSIYGIALANIGIDLTIGMIMSWDAFGPIADNAGGILQMSGFGEQTEGTAEDLDSLGNTTKAYTKAYAISSATLSAFVLFYTFYIQAGLTVLDILTPLVPIMLLLGMLLPFFLSSKLIGSSGKTAFRIVDEVHKQFRENPKIITGEEYPDYIQSVDIATSNALREMVVPSLLGVISPIIVGIFFGVEALGAFILGNWAAIALLGPFFVYAGGAWDNTKKYIESLQGGRRTMPKIAIVGDIGALAPDSAKELKMMTKAAAIVGDTVGDPLKDVAGPSLNIFMKLVNMTALLLLPFLLL